MSSTYMNEFGKGHFIWNTGFSKGTEVYPTYQV